MTTKRIHLLSVSVLVFTLGGCAVFSAGSQREFPPINMGEVKTTSLDRFNVRGYVVAVAICPPLTSCIRSDGLSLTTDPSVIGTQDYDRYNQLRETGQMVFISSGGLWRFNFKVGREYIISVQRGNGIVGATRVI